MEIKRFGRIREVIPLPPLTEIQVESYRRALQADVPPEKRENVGIQAARQIGVGIGAAQLVLEGVHECRQSAG
mgnify:CR=1 FL=1